MRIAGVTGLVVAPIVWITCATSLKTGVLNGFLGDIRFVANDIRQTVARPVPTNTGNSPVAKSAAAKAGEKKTLLLWQRKIDLHSPSVSGRAFFCPF